MKIRSSFITNSSSASYVVTFKTDLTYNELVEKLFKIDRLSIIVDPQIQQYVDDRLQKNKQKIWILQDFTIMYNDQSDFELGKLFEAIENGKIPEIQIIQSTIEGSEGSIIKYYKGGKLIEEEHTGYL